MIGALPSCPLLCLKPDNTFIPNFGFLIAIALSIWNNSIVWHFTIIHI
jgi:hypothetical protein